MRASPGHWLRLWESGEIWRAAAQAKDGNDLARLLGATPDALQSGLAKLRRAGHAVPRLEDLVRGAQGQNTATSEEVSVVCPDREYGAGYERIHGTERQPADEWDDKTDPGIPFPDPVPEGFHVKGLSTLYDADGNPRAQWVKSNRDAEDKYKALTEAVTRLAEPFRGAHEPIAPAADHDSDTLTVYPFGDPHVGLYAWAAETGDDFDLEIAEADLVTAVDHLVGLAPPSKEALIINLGDFFHADTMENRTMRSGHALDVDTRWGKVLSVGIRIMRRAIDKALEKHAQVRVINEIGNHDDHTSIMLGICLANYYEREPRVTIDTSPAKFHWYRFGKCLIGTCHGNGVKKEQLLGVMAVDRAQDWGETEHRAYYTGHIHSQTVREFPGVIVESFRTLSPRDAYAAGAGYRSGQDMNCDVWHREHGRILRHTVGIAQVRQRRRAS